MFYSDNANFAQGSAAIGSGVFVNTVQVAFTPPELKIGPGKFAPAVGFVSQWYNYDNGRMRPLDFNAQTAFVSGRYTVNYWQFGFGGNYTHLLDQKNYHQNYAELLPAVTVQRFFPVGEKLLFSIGDQVGYHFTSVPASLGTYTDINNRLDNVVSLTMVWQITRQLALQPYYRFQFSNYRYNTLQNSDRNDYLNSFGITLACSFNKNFSVRTFFNYNVKQSDDPYIPEYHEYNAGLGATLNFSF